MRTNVIACAAIILIVSVWTPGAVAPAQTGAQPHGHDQAPASRQGAQPPKFVLEQATDTIPRLPRHKVRIVTATLPAGLTGGWHKHPAPVYVYLSEGVAALELDDGTLHHFQAGEAIIEPADTVMRTVNRSATEPAVFVTFQVSDPDQPFSVAVTK
jgi:quercetin dioxygenase-like cupin family protein